MIKCMTFKLVFFFQINLDFERLFPDAHLNFHLNWGDFIENIFSKRSTLLKDSQQELLRNSLIDFNGKISIKTSSKYYIKPLKLSFLMVYFCRGQITCRAGITELSCPTYRKNQIGSE